MDSEAVPRGESSSAGRRKRVAHTAAAAGDRPASTCGHERDVSIRSLRNAGKVLSDLADAGETGRVTSEGKLIGWLVPATEEEQQREELIEQGKLRPGKSGSLAGWKPLPPRTDAQPLSEALQQMRDEEGR